MTRELNQLIKRLKGLTAEDIARVQQFLQQMKAPELRGVPVELRSVQNDALRSEARCEAISADITQVEMAITEPDGDVEAAHAACAQWRRRPFQAIDADDLQPIAALFREAVDTRAASRFRFGSR